MDLGLFTPDEVARAIFEKVTPKYNIPSSHSAVYDISFLCIMDIPGSDETKTLKLANAGIYYSPRFDLLQSRGASRNADKIIWQVSEPFLKVLKDLSGEAILQWLGGAFNHHYWPRILRLELEWLPANRGCWLHCTVYNPNDDHFTHVFSKSMVVGIERTDRLIWTKHTHRFFPAPIRDAVLCLFMLHRRGHAESPFGKLGKDELMHICSFIPHVWPTPCLMYVRSTGITCEGGYVRAVPAAPLMVEHCSHSLLLCRNHFHSGFRLRRIYEPSKTWYRCLTDCEPWWMMAWTGIAKFKSNTFWHRKFVTGAIVDGDWVVVEDSFEEGTGVSVVQRKEEQELRSTKVLEPRIPRPEDVGKYVAKFLHLGDTFEPEIMQILYVHNDEVGTVAELDGKTQMFAMDRFQCCLCVSQEEAARLFVHDTLKRKRQKSSQE